MEAEAAGPGLKRVTLLKGSMGFDDVSPWLFMVINNYIYRTELVQHKIVRLQLQCFFSKDFEGIFCIDSN